MKKLCLLAACFLGGSLAAETIGDLEFQFPPSNYEWRLLNSSDLTFPFSPEIVEENKEFFEEEAKHSGPIKLKIFTHREGDALEIFSAVQTEITDEEGDEDEEECNFDKESIEKEIEEMFGQILPNHKFVILNLEGDENDGLVEWEFNDGIQDLAHGYGRNISWGDKTASFSYFTTAQKSEYNRSVWIQTLSQITSPK